ncbi:MAG: FxsA family protein [Burkholderiales bacterium]|nr:FxsA family protein [Burkholderiales bacterium]
MRFVVLAIVLAFPVADLYVTARIARWTGVPLWIWLACSFLAGLLLLRNERLEFRTRTVAALHGEQSLLRGLLDSGRKVAAAFLLIVPGIVSDLIALVLLALPLNIGRSFEPQPQAVGRYGRDYDAADGDYH